MGIFDVIYEFKKSIFKGKAENAKKDKNDIISKNENCIKNGMFQMEDVNV